MRLSVISIVAVVTGCAPESRDDVAIVRAALEWESEAVAEFREYTPDGDPVPDQSVPRMEVVKSTVEQLEAVVDRFSAQSAAFRSAVAGMSSRTGRGARARVAVEPPYANDMCRESGLGTSRDEQRVADMPTTTPRSEALLGDRMKALPQHDQEPEEEP